MGFSTSGSVAILFVGLLVCLSTVYPVMETANERVTEASEARDDRVLDQANTAVNVTDVGYNASTDTLVVNVTNTGSTTLSVDGTDLLLDGGYVTGATTRVEGDPGRTIWVPGEQLQFELTGVTAGPARVKLVTENGIAETEVL
ncbi:flagellin [Haloarchaeobius salinus]|uniref:flagellin n=1 Tax=Haloarchaeobius salinus TaxID=1198298 RepID=UPI002109055D|nr:flagellin [Haloarchaeobius salinus]